MSRGFIKNEMKKKYINVYKTASQGFEFQNDWGEIGVS